MTLHPITSTVVLCTGGFDPVHSGHIQYFKNAAAHGDQLVIGLNSDAWLQRKKGREFMPWHERAAIIRELKGVVAVIDFDDSDGTACDAIRRVRAMFPNSRILFANGGDRTRDNIPEMSVDDPRVEFLFGVGGQDKANSSSWILKAWQEPIATTRPWGYYTVMSEVSPNVKVKKLHVNPGQSLSMQRHQHRSEFWFVASGYVGLETLDIYGQGHVKFYHQYNQIQIPLGSWHRLFNNTSEPAEIVEIQYGEQCQELDIERR